VIFTRTISIALSAHTCFWRTGGIAWIVVAWDFAATSRANLTMLTLVKAPHDPRALSFLEIRISPLPL
jgi:hypothetical protein